MHNLKKVAINRHHWSPQQLHHFYDATNRSRASTPMKHVEMSKIAHAVERSVYMKNKGISYFYNVPNYPINLVRKDALAIADAKKVKEQRKSHQICR